MEYLAYLHSAFAYEELSSYELVSQIGLLKKAAPNWQRLSSQAWKYMLPLAITLSIVSVVNNALALERGDQGPSVKSLQQNLKEAGFYQAPITQIYDNRTEDAVRRFQKSAGLDVNGVAGSATVQKLESWHSDSATVAQTKKSETSSSRTQAASTDSVTKQRRNPNFLSKGDEGEQVRVLQEQLRVAGYYYGNSTGTFGPITEEAVKRFQLAYNLDADGVVGPATQRKLPPIGVGYGDDTPTRRADGDKLHLGDRGEGVRVLQEQLIKSGYLQGEPNGYFGPHTADAVRRFQAANFLAVSGIAGPTTRAKLYISVNPTANSEFDVQEIQRRLRDRGFYKGSLDGVLNSETKAAIKQAQQFYGISLNDVRSGRY